MSSAVGQPLSSDFLLIVDDNPADVGIMRMALATHGIPLDVRVLTNGQAALDFVEQAGSRYSTNCPVLAILDLHLPRVGGDQILRRLKASASWKDVPVIVTSSSLSSQDRAEAFRLGAAAFFSKPSDLDQFLEFGALVKSVLPKQSDSPETE